VAIVVVAVALAALRAAYALYPFPYRATVLTTAAATGLDPRLLLAVMRVESGFRPQAVSRDGAVGLMQITPATAAWIARQRGLAAPPSAATLRDPAYNIETGAWYLAYLCRRFGGRLAPAVAAYNAGGAPVEAWLRSGTWDATAAGSGAIPFPETRRFVQRVLTTYAVYRLLYPHADRDGGRAAQPWWELAGVSASLGGTGYPGRERTCRYAWCVTGSSGAAAS
jgi:soluble lytic murein transglycosylase